MGQYLSNTNESGTIPILQNFWKVNKALSLNIFCEGVLNGNLQKASYMRDLEIIKNTVV